MTRVKLPEVRCLRCKGRWHPQREEVILCRWCNSPYWDKPRGSYRRVFNKQMANALKADLLQVVSTLKLTRKLPAETPPKK